MSKHYRAVGAQLRRLVGGSGLRFPRPLCYNDMLFMRIIEPDESIFERLPSAHTAGTCTLHSYCVASRQLQWLPSLPPHSKWQRGINTSLSIPYPMSNFESPLLSRIRFPLWPTLIRDTHDLSSKMTIFIYFIVSLAFKVTGFLGMKS